MDKIEAVKAMPFFEGLSTGQMNDLAEIAREYTFQKGAFIFSEGDDGNGFYVAAEGRIKIFKLSPDGKEQILHLFGPGEPFGEVAVFAGRRFPAYANAMEKSEVLFFPRQALIDLIHRTPELALSLLGVLSIRLRRFANLIEDLSLKEVPTRLAAYLLYLSAHQKNESELILDTTKTELAGILGTIPETLSRILSKMTRQNLIATQGRRIRILDRQGLEDLADALTRLN